MKGNKMVEKEHKDKHLRGDSEEKCVKEKIVITCDGV
jgi:hypothetical protein